MKTFVTLVLSVVFWASGIGLGGVFVGSAAWAREAPGDTNVACVQRQLDKLGYDPGPVDGQSGPRTRAALNALVSDAPEEDRAAYARLPAFNKRASVGWCREIARRNVLVRRYLPSRKSPETFAGDDIPSGIVLEIGWKLDSAKGFFSQSYDIEVASQFDLVVASNPKDFRKQLRATREGQHLDAYSIGTVAGQSCGSGDTDGIGGAMFRTVFAICGKELASETIEPGDFERMVEVIVHEYAHHVQRELAYDLVERWVRKGQRPRPRVGPQWLAEGHAVITEIRYGIARQNGGRVPLSLIQFEAAKSKKTLADLRQHAVFDGSTDYHLATFATELLARRYGDQRLIEYWVRVGETDNWYTAFEETFGMSVQAHEALVEELLPEIRQSLEFVRDKDTDGDGRIAGQTSLPMVSAAR